MKDPIEQYLRRYAEPEAANPQLLQPSKFAQKSTYAQCLVVPAFDEAEDFLTHLLRNISDKKDLLVIIVVNAPENQGQIGYDPAPVKRTVKLLQDLVDRFRSFSKIMVLGPFEIVWGSMTKRMT